MVTVIVLYCLSLAVRRRRESICQLPAFPLGLCRALQHPETERDEEIKGGEGALVMKREIGESMRDSSGER